jgi:hypothetical protein
MTTQEYKISHGEISVKFVILPTEDPLITISSNNGEIKSLTLEEYARLQMVLQEFNSKGFIRQQLADLIPCFYCNEKGHDAFSCKKRDEDKKAKKCGICKQPGHYRTSCTHKVLPDFNTEDEREEEPVAKKPRPSDVVIQ